MERRPKKRARKSKPLVEGDPETAEVFTHETISTITQSGATITRQVLVPLVVVNEEQGNTPTHTDEPIEFVGHSENVDYGQPDPPQPRKVTNITLFTAR